MEVLIDLQDEATTAHGRLRLRSELRAQSEHVEILTRAPPRSEVIGTLEARAT